jgi:ribosomal protein RSM22 (predicted rRNA methylase)
VQLTLCTRSGLRDIAVPKSDRDRYRLARKVHWGDTFTYTESDHATDAAR